jgi:hypothetical protein
MDFSVGSVVDRRRARRVRLVAEHGILLARVRPGYGASVVDVSAHGALIETAHRLLPGRSVELHFETLYERVTIRGRVQRCSVADLRDRGISYRGAVGFDSPLLWLTEAISDGYSVLGSLDGLSLQP